MPRTVFVVRDSSPEGYTCLSLFFYVDAAIGTLFLESLAIPVLLPCPKALNLRVVTRFDVVFAQVTNFLED